MNTITRTAITLAGVALAAIPSLAQDANSFTPPTPTTPEQPQMWVYIMVSVFIGGAVIMISIMPSKRSDNQD
ncbi:MAG: hypothetical protein ACYTF7_07775 [Planctomycetota bacterium]|jgi:hypothetical protein